MMRGRERHLVDKPLCGCDRTPLVRALEHDDTQVRARVHPSEQILESSEHGRAHDVERRIVENHPPLRGRFLDDAQLGVGTVAPLEA
jgi:hypothetical protein